MAEKGFILLHRKFWDNPVFDDGERFTRGYAWIWLLTHVYYKETSVMIKGTLYKLQRGQMMASIRYLSKTWRWNARTVMRYLDMLVNEKMITLTVTSCATLITVCNYHKYQVFSPSDSVEYNGECNAEYNSECNSECNNLKESKKNDEKNSKENSAGWVIE